MPEEAVLFERITPHVALITLNRPDKKNAVNIDIAQGLSKAVHTVESDPDLRVAILAAKGNVFCAGADLGEVAAGRGTNCMTETGGFAGFVKEPRTKPWIAAVDGVALGGGFELILACDMAIITETSKLGLPEVKRGLLAAAGGAFRVGISLPRAIANEIVTTGLPLSAERALQYGVVNKVTKAGQAIEAAVEMANEIASNAPLSVTQSLALSRSAHDNTEAELWEMSDKSTIVVMSSDDAKEGPRAFMEKRAPLWSGK